MKAFLAMIILFSSLQVFAQTSQSQNVATDLWEISEGVMYELGADPRLNPKIIYVKVVDTLGTSVKIKFQYEEDMYGKKTCTYYYDTKTDAARPNSALCGS